MHPIPVGKRFKIVVEDHYLGTVTRKELALEDVEKIMNSRPGTVGKFTEEIDVPLHGEFSPAITLPKGAKVLSAAYHIHEAPSVGESLGFGTKDNGTMIGQGSYDEQFAERAPDSAELEKEETLGFTVQGLQEGEKVTSGMVHLVLQYEKFNEWPDLPKTEQEAIAMESGISVEELESRQEEVRQQQQATDEAVKKDGEKARKSSVKAPGQAPAKTQPSGVAQPGGTKPQVTTQPGQGQGHQGATAPSAGS